MKKILIVEDQIDIAELERDYLELNGFEVRIETDPFIGLDLALNQPFDLIILDVMLGEMDGFQICKMIRQRYMTPVIFVSARSEDLDKIKGLGLGADDYLTKPFSPHELVARVKAHITRYENIISSIKEQSSAEPGLQNSDVIKIGHITIEKAAMKVYKSNEVVNMTVREFDLLIFLAENPNIVFSKEKLFEAIWGFNNYGDISTVAVHIKRIREKLEVDPSHPVYIETLWGAGYRMNRS